jgi:hypothetical protein
MTDRERDKWQRDLAEMEILLMILGLLSWVTFWSMVHYKIIALVYLLMYDLDLSSVCLCVRAQTPVNDRSLTVDLD